MKQSGLVLMIFVSQRRFQKANPAVFRGVEMSISLRHPHTAA